MRSTQVAAAWVASLFQGPESQAPSRHKFLKLLIINNLSSGAASSPVANSPNLSGRLGLVNLTKSESADSDESGSGVTDDENLSPEGVLPVSRLHAGQDSAISSSSDHSASILSQKLSSGVGEGVQDILKECVGVMQVLPSVVSTSSPVCSLNGFL
jgi:hypothetical protein